MRHGSFHRWRKIPFQGRLQAELVQVCGHGLTVRDGETGSSNNAFPTHDTTYRLPLSNMSMAYTFWRMHVKYLCTLVVLMYIKESSEGVKQARLTIRVLAILLGLVTITDNSIKIFKHFTFRQIEGGYMFATEVEGCKAIPGRSQCSVERIGFPKRFGNIEGQQRSSCGRYMCIHCV